MGVLKILLFLFLIFSVIHAASGCSTSVCGNRNFTVRFPFWIQGQQRRTCGYAGFDLSCSSQGVTLLNLPYSGEFFVRDINYGTQKLQLYDPYNCLPRRLLDFNLSGTPFLAPYYVNYTFLICPSEPTRSRFRVIDCLSNSTNTTLATSSITLARKMTMCQIIVTLPVPVSWLHQHHNGFSSDLTDDLQLTWDVPDCKDCAAQGDICGFKNNRSQGVICLKDPETGKTNGLQVLKIISISIVIPGMACAFGIACFICFISSSSRGATTSTRQPNLNPAAITPQPTSAVTVSGLDESTIESYTKVVLGESLRLPGPNDGTCPVCLSEYRAQEMVRSIPDCKHCFHADCIDEWLRINSTCPVCRNSPSPVHINPQHV